MKKFINKLLVNHSLIYKLFLYVATIILVVYLFPKGGQFKYEFQKGKPWEYENYYAPFDFAIQKTEDEIALEKQQVIESSKQFYEYDENVVLQVKNSINEKIENALLNSDLILNLNEPNKLGDVSWVQPGKYIGIWWAMHVNEKTWGSGAKHGSTTEETKRYIDFAAQYGFDGVLVEGWNEGWDGSWFHNGDVFSFTQPYDDFDLQAISQYGLAKNVRLIGHHETSGSVTNYRKQMSAAYDLYQQHGVTQIKTGYVADGGDIKRVDNDGITRHEWHDGQFMVNEYLHSVESKWMRA